MKVDPALRGSSSESTLPLALTMGDPAGIGPDITLAAYASRAAHNLPPFYVHADISVLVERAVSLNLDIAFHDLSEPHPDGTVDTSSVASVFANALPVMPLTVTEHVTTGAPDSVTAPAVLQSIEAAVQDVRSGAAAAVVTNPIAKDVLYSAGFQHPGHTEFLATLAHTHWGVDARPVMMLAAEEMRVVPATIHIPLKDVPAALTTDLLRDTLEIVLRSLAQDFGVAHPRVACAGLNPHAGENGTIGDEDENIIAPVIAALREEGHDVTGPFPADTLFHAEARARFDAIVAMYHDQALIPIKTLAFDRGVNVTLGLPFVRTSPDHGTAFSIAGTGSANPRSLIEALKAASHLATNRLGHAIT